MMAQHIRDAHPVTAEDSKDKKVLNLASSLWKKKVISSYMIQRKARPLAVIMFSRMSTNL